MKKILVADSFHSNKIANLLKNLYGDKVEVYCESGHFPNVKDDTLGYLLARTSEITAPQFKNTTEKRDFDVFFLSARLIIEGSVNPLELKQKHGTPNAKVVAMSVSPEYLNEVKNGNFGVDFFQNKNVLITEKVENLDKETQITLNSYLN